MIAFSRQLNNRRVNLLNRFEIALFSSGATQAKKSASKRTVVPETTKYKPIVCISEYGDLLNVKPMTKLVPADWAKGGKEDYRQVFMIDDNTDHKNLIKKMNHNPKAFFLFNPQGNYANAMSIYTALKRSLD